MILNEPTYLRADLSPLKTVLLIMEAGLLATFSLVFLVRRTMEFFSPG